MFIDRAKIHLISGKGGDGALSFRREKHVEMGGPDGGSGGKGGDVWVEADPQKNTLYDFTYRPLFKAEAGENGRAKRQTGACGEDLVIKVPPGTLLFKEGKLVADLKTAGDRYLAAPGGKGGRGNSTFKTAVNTAPHLREGSTKLASSAYPVLAGKRITLPVVGDWRDDESDTVSVSADEGVTVDGQGRVEFLAGVQPGVVSVPYLVSDGRGEPTKGGVDVEVA